MAWEFWEMTEKSEFVRANELGEDIMYWQETK